MNNTYKSLIAICLVSGCGPDEYPPAVDGSETSSLPSEMGDGDASETGGGDASETGGGDACISDDDCHVDENCNDGNCVPAMPGIPEPPPKELCNGVDDDGDAEIDEDYQDLGEICVMGVGVCEVEGFLVCSEDELGTTCDAVPGAPTDEVCNSLDDDCDGQTDEGELNVCGVCGVDPVELCNGQDDDCDGQTDEGVTNACGHCGPVPSEVCNGQDDDCNGQTDEGVTNACGQCGPVPSEVCNGQDDNCNGHVDDGLACPSEVKFTPKSLIQLCPKHTEGDPEFAGHGPEVTANVSLYHNKTQVRADIDIVWDETFNGDTEAELHENPVLWTAPQGCTITGIISPLGSTCNYIDDDHDPDLCNPPQPNGPVDYFKILGDTGAWDVNGCDWNKAYASVYFNKITVEVICP